jgi:hypothetical protein
MVMAMCRDFGCLPSQLYAEDARVMQQWELDHLVREEEARRHGERR